MGNRVNRTRSSVSFAIECAATGSRAQEAETAAALLRKVSESNAQMRAECAPDGSNSSPNSYSPFFFRANRAPSFLVHRSPAPARKKSVFVNLLSGCSSNAQSPAADRRTSKRHKWGGVKRDRRQLKNASTRRQQDIAAKLTLTARANMLPATFDDSQLAVLLREAIEYSTAFECST